MPEVQEGKPPSEAKKYVIAVVLATLGALAISQSGTNVYVFIAGFGLCCAGLAVLT